jgi:hypothetical protein
MNIAPTFLAAVAKRKTDFRRFLSEKREEKHKEYIYGYCAHLFQEINTYRRWVQYSFLQILSERRENHAQNHPEAGTDGTPSGARSVLQLY